MSFFWSEFCAALLPRLKKARFWCELLFLPAAAAFFLWCFPPAEVSAPVQVGVALPEQGGDALWQLLEGHSGTVVSFILADEETICRQVLANHWDCGIVVEKDFEERLGELDTDGLITLITGPGSTVYPLVQETAAACVMELCSPEIAGKYLRSSGLADKSSIRDAQRRLQELLRDVDRVGVSMNCYGGGELEPVSLAREGIEQILRGAVAVSLFVWAGFAAVELGQWLETPFAMRLRALTGTSALLLPRLAALLLPAFCSGFLALCLLPGGRGLAGAPLLLPYTLWLALLAAPLARLRPVRAVLPVLIPFAAAACFLLCPVLLDITAVWPGLSALSACIPVTWFIRACQGQGAFRPVLYASLAGFPVLALLLSVRRERSQAAG